MSILQKISGGQHTMKETAGTVEPNNGVELKPAEYASRMGELFLTGGTGPLNRFTYSGYTSCVDAYQKCPPLSAIINRKAQAHINGKTWILNREDQKEAVNEASIKLKKLLAKPNPLQTWDAFEAQKKIYMQLFGFCIVLPIHPVGYENRDNIEATSLWNIPPYMVNIKESGKLFYQTSMSGIISEVVLDYRGTKTTLKADKIYFFKEFTPSFETLVLPGNRVKAHEKPINNIIAAYESRQELISYAGSQGIISPEGGSGQFVGMPLDPKDKLALQDDFRRQYGIRKGQFRYIISPTAVKWSAMGTKPKDLLLIEEVVESSKSLCDGWGYPPHLLGLIDPTFNNQKEAQKSLYLDHIIPESHHIDEAWNEFFQTEKYGIIIERDFSLLPIMQADKVQEANARFLLNQALEIEWKMGLITLDDWLKKLGEDPLPNGVGQVRVTDTNNKNIPLAVTIGVGGVQGLISVLTATGMEDSARQAVLEIVFGIASSDAARMAVSTGTSGSGGSGSTDTPPPTA